MKLNSGQYVLIESDNVSQGKNIGIGQPFPSSRSLYNPEIKRMSPALQVDFFTIGATMEAHIY